MSETSPSASLDRPDAEHASGPRYRVWGPLPEEVALRAEQGAVFVRRSYDGLGRAVLVVGDQGYLVRYEALKRRTWQWRETGDVRREFGPGQVAAACRYFNSIALSPGYIGQPRVEPGGDDEPGGAG